MSRNSVLRVKCRFCGAGVGARCVVRGTDQPLRFSVAHDARLADVGLPADYAAVDRVRKVDADRGK